MSSIMKMRCANRMSILATAILSTVTPLTSKAAVGNPLTPQLTLASLPYYPLSTAVVRDGSGNALVLWSQSPKGTSVPLAFAKFSETGSTLLAPTAVPGTDGQGAERAAAMDAAGDFVIVYQCGTQNGGTYTPKACVQIYSPSGIAQGDPIVVASATPTGPKVTASEIDSLKVSMSSDGSFVVAWSDTVTRGRPSGPLALSNTNQVYTRAYRLDGTAKGSAVVISSQTTPLGTGSQGTPVTGLAMNPSGAYALSWSSWGYRFKARFFDASGKATSSTISLPSSLSNYKDPMSVSVRDTVAVTPSGDVLVAWDVVDSSVMPTTDAVYVGRYSANGSLKSAVTKALTRTPVPGHGTGGLSLIATSDNGYWLSWGAFSTTDNVNATRTLSAQAFDATDKAIGNAFTVGSDAYNFGDIATDSLMPFIEGSVDATDNLFAVWGSISARLFEGP